MTTSFSCSIVPDYFLNAPALDLAIRLDDQTIFDQTITESVDFVWEIDEDFEGPRTIEFIMKNKTYEHSPWDSEGRSLGDCQLEIKNICFDQIELKQVFIDHSEYLHNFNDPNRDTVSDQFHGIMGCNGRVIFRFETPVYLWLLENM